MCLISPAVRSQRHIHSLVFGLFESSASLFPSFLASLGLIYRARTPLPPFVYSSTCLSIHLPAGLFSVSFLSICLHLHCVSFLPGARFNFLPTLLFHFLLFLTVFPPFNLSFSCLTTHFLWKTLTPLFLILLLSGQQKLAVLGVISQRCYHPFLSSYFLYVSISLASQEL